MRMPLSRSVTWSQRLMLASLGDMYLRSPKIKQTKSWFTFGDPMGSVEGRSGFALGSSAESVFSKL